MNAELVRGEVQRLLRKQPFEPFVLTFVGGERAVVDHSENVAFDPRPGASAEFYVITGRLRMFTTFDAVSSITNLSDVGTAPGDPARV